ncbi:MAG: hypothetical protein V3R84_05140 [Acidimicrobiia bacterium]
MKNLARNVALLGGVLVVASVAFEYVRMAPSYRFIVEPWSIRGYDLTQGKVVAAIGVGTIVISLLAASSGGSTRFNMMAGFGIWLAAVLIAQFPDPPPIDLELETFAALVIVTILSYILARSIVNSLAERIPKAMRRYATLGLLVVLSVIGFFAIAKPNFVVPNSAEVDLSVVVAIFMGLVVISAATAQPRELAIARISIATALMGWIVVATVGTSARTHLIELQLEAIGVSGTYRDTQITSGVMAAFFGILLVFLGSTGLWARKRDRLQVIARAHRQQEAARESAAEIAAANRLLEAGAPPTGG